MKCSVCSKPILTIDNVPTDEPCEHVAFIFMHSLSSFDYESELVLQIRKERGLKDCSTDNYTLMDILQDEYAEQFDIEECEDAGGDECGMHEFVIYVGMKN